MASRCGRRAFRRSVGVYMYALRIDTSRAAWSRDAKQGKGPPRFSVLPRSAADLEDLVTINCPKRKKIQENTVVTRQHPLETGKHYLLSLY